MSDVVTATLSGAALFNSHDFYEINQLADLLFGSTEESIQLYSEHELVTRAWIMSALQESDLAQRTSSKPLVTLIPIPDAWLYTPGGKLTRPFSSGLAKDVCLYLPDLHFEQRVKVLEFFCVETLQTHLLTIPLHTIHKALEWQSYYCADRDVLAHTMLLLQRAANRLMMLNDEQQALALDPRHVADVLADWQCIHAEQLLSDRHSNNALGNFLSEHIIGQDVAIEKFIHHRFQSKIFVLAGPLYSGKHTFIEKYAFFTHAEKRFFITFHLDHFSSESSWETIFLSKPACFQQKKQCNFLELLMQYPHAIICLVGADKNPILLEKLGREIHRGFFQIQDTIIDIKKNTWMLVLDIAFSRRSQHAIQQSTFSNDLSLELSDILYSSMAMTLSEDMPEENAINNGDELIEIVKKQLPDSISDLLCILPFFPLSEKEKRHMINNEIRRIIQCLRSVHNISLYYQEEVLQFLLQQINESQRGFEELHKNLYYQIEKIFLKAIEKGMILEDQVLMLQLNDTGRVLQIVRTHARSTTPSIKFKP